VFNIGTAYSWTERVTLTGDFEYVRGLNEITNVGTTSSGVSFQTPTSLGSYALVSNQTYRVSAGVDYRLRPRVTTYFRYNYYDFGDLATGVTSGTTHLFLAGMSATY
jgi:opacity protein-like surface antigen